MKDSKFKHLIAAAQREEPMEPPAGFAWRVVSAINRESRQATAPSLFDQLALLFPRFALAAVMIIGICVVTEWYFTEKQAPLAESVEQVTEEWIFAAK